MIRDLSELARVTGGVLHGVDAAFGTVTTDSRSLEPGSLFVALRGERFDGHDFAATAAGRGACAVVVSRDVDVSVPRIVVDDTLAALSAAAAAWRAGFDLPLVGVGGSNGKTTTRNMLSTILGRRYRVLEPEANFNNDIGDYWEWSDQGWYPLDLSNEGYKLGVNYIIYAMTH